MARVSSGKGWVLTSGGWKRQGDTTRSAVNAPSPDKLLIGANVVRYPSPGAPAGINSTAQWTARCTAVGQMGIRRSYDSGINTNFTAGPAAPTVGLGIVNYTSVRPGTIATLASGGQDANVIALAQSIPATEYVLLSAFHEPEDDGVSAATWVTAQQRFYDLVKANVANPARVLVGPTLQGFTFNTASRNPQDWNVGAAHCDFYGVDFYQPYHYPQTGNSPNWVNPVAANITNFQAYIDALGKPGIFGEIGCSDDTTLLYKNVQASTASPNPQHKIDWIQAYVDFATAHGWLGLCYFDSYKNGDTDPSIVLDSTPGMTTYWKQLCASHVARSF